ncbi:MAG: hypothetical protein B6D41_07895 [Chloroflexi bacterium UTCFX4]|nr:MAG: hypothetical protein B6D41_07895 [Chloroflexi bacterium UTCFX4]
MSSQTAQSFLRQSGILICRKSVGDGNNILFFGGRVEVPNVRVGELDRKEHPTQQEPADEQTHDESANAKQNWIGKQTGTIFHCASARASGYDWLDRHQASSGGSRCVGTRCVWAADSQHCICSMNRQNCLDSNTRRAGIQIKFSDDYPHLENAANFQTPRVFENPWGLEIQVITRTFL